MPANPAPVTEAEIRCDIRRQLRKRGCDGYRRWEYSHVGTIDFPECIDGCGAGVRYRGIRCGACSHDHMEAREAARREKEREARIAAGKRTHRRAA